VWKEAADARDRDALDEWCGAVGTPVVNGAPVPVAPIDDPSRTTTVITWNVHVGAGDIAALVGAARSGTLTGKPATSIVLLLQEAARRGGDVPVAVPERSRIAHPIIPPRSAEHDITAVARVLGMHLVYVPSMRNGREAEDRGNAILATEPLRDVEAIELPLGRQRRGAEGAPQDWSK
jgi:endonuclease/exonuclease/phosphatase family metal-dependent hydrolase